MNDSDHARLLAVADKWQALYNEAVAEKERILDGHCKTLDEVTTLTFDLVDARAENVRLRAALQTLYHMVDFDLHNPQDHSAWKEASSILAAAASGTGPETERDDDA